MIIPKSIFDCVPERYFSEALGTWEDEHIKSGRCYEYYWAIGDQYSPRSILELGVRYGYSLLSLMMSSEAVECEGWDIDCEALKITKEKLADFPWFRHRLICADTQMVKSIGRRFDLAHVDDVHSFDGALHSMNLVWPICKVMLVDDAVTNSDVAKAVEDFRGRTNARFEMLPSWNGLAMFQK